MNRDSYQRVLPIVIDLGTLQRHFYRGLRLTATEPFQTAGEVLFEGFDASSTLCGTFVGDGQRSNVLRQLEIGSLPSKSPEK